MRWPLIFNNGLHEVWSNSKAQLGNVITNVYEYCLIVSFIDISWPLTIRTTFWAAFQWNALWALPVICSLYCVYVNVPDAKRKQLLNQFVFLSISKACSEGYSSTYPVIWTAVNSNHLQATTIQTWSQRIWDRCYLLGKLTGISNTVVWIIAPFVRKNLQRYF